MSVVRAEILRAPAVTETILLGWAAGLLTGTVQAVVLLVTRFGLGRLTFYGPDVAWLTPLGNAVVFGAVAAALALLCVLLRIRLPAAWIAGGFAFLGVFAQLIPFGALSRWVAALVSFAVALQVGRNYAAAPDRWRRRVRLIAHGLALATLVVGLGQTGVRALHRAGALRALTTAAEDSPNVLLVIWDTVRGDELSIYGNPRQTTPTLERWASQGVVFQQAVSTAPWTLPSHASFFTGRLGESLGGGWVKPISNSAPTLAELLRDRGYQTGGFAANLLYASHESGLARGFIDYQDYAFSLRRLVFQCPLLQTMLVHSLVTAQTRGEVKRAVLRFNLTTDWKPALDYVPASVITDRFLRWQTGVRGRPFFAFLNYFDAHQPYRSPPNPERPAPDYLRYRYDASIRYLDGEFGRLLDSLKQRGMLQHTLVILAADHGELFGRRHGLWGHANSLYLAVLRVPLVLWYPARIPGGVRVAEPVSLRDLPATILDLTGSGPGSLGGQSLTWMWNPSSTTHSASPVISQVGRSREANPRLPNNGTDLASVLEGEYQYIRSGIGHEELYAWRTDSLERHNLVGQAASEAVLQHLRSKLTAGIRADREGNPSISAARQP